MKATAKDLRFNSKALLDTVKRGEVVVITFRGKPCAKLIPYDEENGQNTTNELYGNRATMLGSLLLLRGKEGQDSIKHGVVGSA